MVDLLHWKKCSDLSLQIHYIGNKKSKLREMLHWSVQERLSNTSTPGTSTPRLSTGKTESICVLSVGLCSRPRPTWTSIWHTYTPPRREWFASESPSLIITFTLLSVLLQNSGTPCLLPCISVSKT